MSERDITFTIKGKFTPFELAALLAFTRKIGDPRKWEITVDDPEIMTLDEANALLRTFT